MEKIMIIGGGIGGAIAHDLSLRGFAVVVLEKGELCCGSTGRHHGLLHSGARYALHDVVTAAECMTENRILRTIAAHALVACRLGTAHGTRIVTDHQGSGAGA